MYSELVSKLLFWLFVPCSWSLLQFQGNHWNLITRNILTRTIHVQLLLGNALINLIVKGCQNLISCFPYSSNDIFFTLSYNFLRDHVKNCNFCEVVQIQGDCCFCSKLLVSWTCTKKKGGKICWLISFVSIGFSSQIDRSIPFYLCHSSIQN